jgi:hypothetical protein
MKNHQISSNFNEHEYCMQRSPPFFAKIKRLSAMEQGVSAAVLC